MFTTVIKAQELTKLIDNPKLAILDCRFDLTKPQRGIADYRLSHISGAVYVSLDQDLSDHNQKGMGRHPLPSPEALTGLFSRLGITEDTQVVAYDYADGSIAARAWWLLRYMQHNTVAVLDGGWNTWVKSSLPVKGGTEKRAPSIFKGAPQKAMWVPVKEVLTAPVLVDSRAPERYSGEVEPLDPVAGHIPGAVNRFYNKNLNSDNHFLDPSELRKQFKELFKAKDPNQAVFYCGSGVTACHNILASAYAGFPQSKLFPGSWSQWCSDPNRPIESKNKSKK